MDLDNYDAEKENLDEMIGAFMDENDDYLASIGESIKDDNGKEKRMVNDLSNGIDKTKIRAMNEVDDDSPAYFNYISHVIYPYWYTKTAPAGCNCTKGCSDSRKCLCVKKNGGEIPFNENGAILRAKPLVHECGPLCQCPPTCMNRVTQHGIRSELEIFKTESRGWGVRSRSFVSSGEFICEYTGELLEEKEAEKRVDNDEYLFDVCKNRFAIDARKSGNVGRFINHSCLPNLYVQKVLYDHGDKNMPHLMFFATEDIPPLTELTCSYSYGQVCDKNGIYKTKDCRCGAPNCVKRLY